MALDPAEFRWLLGCDAQEVRALDLPRGSTFGASGPELMVKLASDSSAHRLFTIWAAQQTPDGSMVSAVLAGQSLRGLTSANRRKFEGYFRRFRAAVDRIRDSGARELGTLVNALRGHEVQAQGRSRSFDQSVRRVREELLPRVRHAIVKTKDVLVALSAVDNQFAEGAQGTFDWKPAYAPLASCLGGVASAEAAVREAHDLAGEFLAHADSEWYEAAPKQATEHGRIVCERTELALISLDEAFAALAEGVREAGERYAELATGRAKGEVAGHLAAYNPAAASGLLALDLVLTAVSVAAGYLVPPPFSLLSGPAIKLTQKVIGTLATSLAAASTVADDEVRAEALLRAKKRQGTMADETGKFLAGAGAAMLAAKQTSGTLEVLGTAGVLTVSESAKTLFAGLPFVGVTLTGAGVAHALYQFGQDLHDNRHPLPRDEVAALMRGLQAAQDYCWSFGDAEVRFVGVADDEFVFETTRGLGTVRLDGTLRVHYSVDRVLDEARYHASRSSHPDNRRVDWDTLVLGEQTGADRHWAAWATVDGYENSPFELSAEFEARLRAPHSTDPYQLLWTNEALLTDPYHRMVDWDRLTDMRPYPADDGDGWMVELPVTFQADVVVEQLPEHVGVLRVDRLREAFTQAVAMANPHAHWEQVELAEFVGGVGYEVTATVDGVRREVVLDLDLRVLPQ